MSTTYPAQHDEIFNYPILFRLGFFQLDCVLRGLLEVVDELTLCRPGGINKFKPLAPNYVYCTPKSTHARLGNGREASRPTLRDSLCGWVVFVISISRTLPFADRFSKLL